MFWRGYLGKANLFFLTAIALGAIGYSVGVDQGIDTIRFVKPGNLID